MAHRRGIAIFRFAGYWGYAAQSVSRAKRRRMVAVRLLLGRTGPSSAGGREVAHCRARLSADHRVLAGGAPTKARKTRGSDHGQSVAGSTPRRMGRAKYSRVLSLSITQAED